MKVLIKKFPWLIWLLWKWELEGFWVINREAEEDTGVGIGPFRYRQQGRVQTFGRVYKMGQDQPERRSA